MMNVYDLIRYASDNPKLMKLKPSTRHPDLFVAKYTKTAFFGGAWDRVLEDSRGTVIRIRRFSGLGGDIEEVELAALPFRKIYNYGIDKESPVFPLDTVVEAYRKVNGFMIAITPMTNGELLFSTTGSLDSEFVDMAKEVFDKTIREPFFRATVRPGRTYMFECVHENDPHIVPEEVGLYFLGYRAHDFAAPVICDRLHREDLNYAGCLTPFKYTMTLGQLLETVKTVEHEGFVFYTKDGQSAKLKSPYYLAAKMFGRGNIDTLLNGRAKKILDEELWPLVDHVKANREAFSSMGEQDKLVFCREFLTNLYSTNAKGY